MGKIGIFGGTFNPIHKGHMRAALAARRMLGLDTLLLIPTHIPPHKSSADVVAGEHRLNMCALAARPHPFVQVSDIELTQAGPSYTIYTLEQLAAQYPGDTLYLIIGSDMLLTFSQWYRWQDILRQSVIVGISRKHEDENRLSQAVDTLRPAGGNVILLDTPVYAMSSTQIRESIRTHENTTRFLHKNVYRYICDHQLYFEP